MPIDATSRRYGWQYWKTPVLFGTGFCVLQVLIGVWRFRTMRDPVSLWLAIPSLLPGFLLFFGSGLLVGLGVRRILKGVDGPWRIVLSMAFVAATPLAVWLSLVGGLLGPHGVVIGALAPYVLILGPPALVRKCWPRAHAPRASQHNGP